MAFLQVITRTFLQRQGWLEQNRRSLMALVDKDWMQTFVIDDVGRGVEWANANLSTVMAQGDYVWVLDDDDICANPRLISDIRPLAGAEVIVVRADHALYGVLPHARNWGGAPVHGDCTWSNYIFRSDVWESNRGFLAGCAKYAADYYFAKYLWDKGLRFAWCDILGARYLRQSQGASECQR